MQEAQVIVLGEKLWKGDCWENEQNQGKMFFSAPSTFRASTDDPGFLVDGQWFREGADWSETHLTPILLPALTAESVPLA